MIEDDKATMENRRAGRRRRVALAGFVVLAIVLGVAAVLLFFWSLGRGLTTPGGVADRESELLALGGILAGIAALAALIGAVGVASTGGPLPGRLRNGLLTAFVIVSVWLVVRQILRL